MHGPVKLGDPDLEPTDEQLAGRMRRALAGIAALRARSLREAPANYRGVCEVRVPTYFDIEVSLSTVYPMVWRRFLLRSTGTTFADLHRAIQDACGWQDYHLYRFAECMLVGLVGLAQAPGEIDEDLDDSPPADEAPLTSWLGKHLPRACHYVYDFGDDWHHDVIVRDIVDSEERFFRRLVGGERSFPPEDCGGLPGFERILEFRRTGVDPDGEDDLGRWLGDWQPEVNLARLRTQFDAARKPRVRR